jgi:hypothetical protein
MDHYAGIDVSLELSSICVVDAKGKIMKKAKSDVMGIEQPATEGAIVAALAVGEEAAVANPVEAIRQGLQHETSDKLVGIERHQFGLAWR